MPTDISVDEVEQYTRERLDKVDAETARMLAAALSVARRKAGWHVSPVRTVELTLDGPDSRILWLPTMHVDSLTGVSENGIDLNLAGLAFSVGDGSEHLRRSALRKRNGGFWSDQYGSIVVRMDHGLELDAAEDWRQAILSMVDQMSLVPVSDGTGVSEFGLSGKRVDDVDYRYNAYAAMAEEVIFSIENVIGTYQLPAVEYF